MRLSAGIPSARAADFVARVFCAGALVASCYVQTAIARTLPDTTLLQARVQSLTQPSFAGRGNGTLAAAAAADSLADWMATCGLEPAGTSGWFQDFPLTGPEYEGLTGRNVVGYLPGQGALQGRFVVIGAHYDHLGRLEKAGQSDPPDPPDPPERGAYYPGANDNASGVAVLLELARLRGVATAAGEPQSTGCESFRGCLFVSFAAEEIGLQGSAHFVKNLPVPRDSVDAMLNFDCVGQLTDDKLYVGGVGTAAAFSSLVATANEQGLKLALSQGGWSGSDHVSFNTIAVPVLFLFTGPYVQYNRPEDDWPTLTYPGLARVVSYSESLLTLVAEHPDPFPHITVAQADLRPPGGDAPPRKAWLGTIPDFTAEITGVMLAGVIEGSPAARAGLSKGDILVSFADRPVTDLAGLTRLLRTHDPGEQINLEILRQGQRLHYIVVLADRSERE